MRVSRGSAVLTLAAMAAASGSSPACVSGPRFVKPAAEAPTAWRSPAFAASPVASVAVTDAPDPKWWRALGDPTLDALEERAAAANLDLQEAALRLAQTRVQRRVAGAEGKPRLDASASYQRERQSEVGVGTRVIDVIPVPGKDEIIEALSEPYSVFQAGFDASWELDLFGRVKRTLEAADARTQASAENARDVARLIAAEVARRYVELRGTQALLVLARSDEEAAGELLELTRQRADAGLVTDVDVTRQRSLLAEVRARMPQLEAAEDEALNKLALLLAAQPGTLSQELREPAEAPLVPARVPVGLPSDVVRRRPDVRQAEARLHAATADIGIAMADLYPRISLGGNAGVQSLGAGDLVDWGARAWSIGPFLKLPLFDGGRRKATVELRRVQQQEAAIAFRKAVLVAFHEVDDALTGYGAEQRRRELLAEGVSSGEAAYELARTRYEHGLTDSLAALEAQHNLITSRRAWVESGTAVAVRFVALNKALGGGWEAPQEDGTAVAGVVN
jgi:NodT family efflux transporter outer membrane factor (OMF) lipoprotein